MKINPKRVLSPKFAAKKVTIREIKNSFFTTMIFGAIGVAVLFAKKAGYTEIYTDPNEYGTAYLFLSSIGVLIIHDTYFYFGHKLMHHPKLYKAFHFEHHKSLDPSPYTAYSFNWKETLVEAAFFPMIIMLVPLHPIAMASFLVQAVAINVVGHMGYEVFPKFWIKLKIFNSVTHHHMHHQTANYNFGLYFTFWDRVFGTLHPHYEEVFEIVTDTNRSEQSNLNLRKLCEKIEKEKKEKTQFEEDTKIVSGQKGIEEAV